MPNIEMKATYDDLDRARSVAVKLGGKFLWKDRQVDTYFRTKKGKLKLRQSRLNGNELLPYIKIDEKGLKRSDYAKLPVSDASLVEDLFNQLLGTSSRVEKTREVYFIGNIRIHLDQVEGLGCFLEFEAVFSDDTPEVEHAESRKVAELMQKFGVKSEHLLSVSYPELLSMRRPEILA